MRRGRETLSAEPDRLRFLVFFSIFVFVAFSLVGIDVFSVNVLGSILIFRLDAFSFWIHGRSSVLVPKGAP